jgi:hypothetical protein
MTRGFPYIYVCGCNSLVCPCSISGNTISVKEEAGFVGRVSVRHIDVINMNPCPPLHMSRLLSEGNGYKVQVLQTILEYL